MPRADSRIRAGRLDQRIIIEEVSTTVDAKGNRVESWAAFYECWANISTSGGREFFQAKQTNAALTHQVEIRFYPGITPKKRIKYIDLKNNGAERFFDIESIVNPDEGRVKLLLMCKELP